MGAPVIGLERATCGPRPGASTGGSPATAGWREIKGKGRREGRKKVTQRRKRNGRKGEVGRGREGPLRRKRKK